MPPALGSESNKISNDRALDYIWRKGVSARRSSLEVSDCVCGSVKYMAVAQKTGIPKWVALVSGNMDQHLRSQPLATPKIDTSAHGPFWRGKGELAQCPLSVELGDPSVQLGIRRLAKGSPGQIYCCDQNMGTLRLKQLSAGFRKVAGSAASVVLGAWVQVAHSTGVSGIFGASGSPERSLGFFQV